MFYRSSVDEKKIVVKQASEGEMDVARSPPSWHSA